MKKAKKSGFTMIEMLATILVLLVVVLIATPSIRRMVTNSEELSKSYTEELVLDAARDYATVNNKEVTKDLKIVGNYTIISLETLKNIGLIEEEDITKLGVDARVKVTLEEDLYVKFEIVYDSLLTEDIKPTIILLGEDPYYLLQGKVYVDPGYVAFDRHGNTITDLVVVTGTVNKDVIGTYTLTYSLTDNEGNVGDPVTRVVNVVDSTYPAVTVAIAESNNIYHNKFVRNSETVTLNLTFSKIVTDPTVLIGGRTATVTGSGNTRVATYEIPEFESLLVSQALSVLVKDYEDIYENEGIEATNVTSGGLVVYDNIKPLITSTTIISNNTFNKYAKNGHIITMTTNFTEPVRSLTSTIHGRTPTTTNGLNTSTVTKTYTIPVAESTLVQGDVVGLITEYMDRAGNIGISNDIRLSGGTVVYDRTAPVCGTWTPNPSPWKASGTQTFTLASSTDILSGINVVGGPCTTGGAHGNTCTVTISDRSLNTLVCTSPINRVDTTPPAVTTHNPTSSDWVNADIPITIGGGADAESGFLRREYCYTTNGTTCTPSTIGNSATFTATGQYTLCSRAVDNVNNLSTPTTCSVANAYKIDKTIPTTPTVSYTNGYVTSTTQSVTFSSTDGESGVSSYTVYRRSAAMTGGTWGAYGAWGSLGTQTSPYTSTVASGNCYQYYVTATNGVSLSASSSTSPASVTKVDTSAPGATTVSYTNGYITSTTQSVTFSSTGDTESGIVSYTLYRRSATMTGGTCGAYGAWGSLGTQTSPYTSTVTSGNCYQYYVLTRNGASLTSSSTTSPTSVTKVDTSAPGATTVSYANGYITSTTQSVTFSSTGDSQSGISSYTVYRRSATMTNGTCGAYGAWGSLGAQTSPYTSTVVSGNCYQYYVLTRNNAGLTSNSSTSPASVTKVDTSVPVCGTWTPSISPWKASGTQSFTLAGSTDTQSGISTAGGSCVTGAT
ncbi:MAG: DUF5011 domain-containing protein, partial [Bacilli bacterium]|nr:DUF5011 domain-containing protein [Bacilli bacterium]